jgi:NitT/TauT family transport system permease protein
MNKKYIINKIILPFSGIIIFLLVWHWIVSLMMILTTNSLLKGFLPLDAIKNLWWLFFQSYFWISIFSSLKRIILGLVITTVIAIPLGLFLGISSLLKRISNIPIQFLRMISPISWMPIALFFFARL